MWEAHNFPVAWGAKDPACAFLEKEHCFVAHRVADHAGFGLARFGPVDIFQAESEFLVAYLLVEEPSDPVASGADPVGEPGSKVALRHVTDKPKEVLRRGERSQMGAT